MCTCTPVHVQYPGTGKYAIESCMLYNFIITSIQMLLESCCNQRYFSTHLFGEESKVESLRICRFNS